MPVTSHRRHALTALSIGAVLSVVLAACGDDDDTAASTIEIPSTPVVTGTVEGGGTAAPGSAAEQTTDRDAFVAEAASAMGLEDEGLAECLAGTLVDTVGMERIVEAGVTPDEFARASDLEEMGLSITPDDAAALETELADCGDLVAGFANSGLSGDEADCVREVLTNELAAELIVVDLAGIPASPELEAARDSASACITAASTTTG